MTVARRFTVRGEVQGVGFRWAARDEAIRLGLVGTVRNLRDGAVEALAQGEPDAVERFAAWLARGPRWAEVREVTTEEVPALAAASFEIRSDR
jgi:acylphosphatase